MIGLIARKVGMSQIFDKHGTAVAVTVVELGENIVVNKFTDKTHNHNAVQVGGFLTKERKLNKPEKGQFKKQELPLLKPLKEFRVSDTSNFNIGDKLNPSEIVKVGMLVDIQGKSIGKGFQGTVKRFHAGRGPMSHGSKFHRSMGSIGAGTTPGHVFKGVIMPGQMGNKTCTVRHLEVVKVDAEKGLLLVKGATPGVEGGLLIIRPSKTKWNIVG